MSTLSIIGCGKVGKTLGRLWREARVFDIGSILNRSSKSAALAAEFIGGGAPVDSYADLGESDLMMIAASDDSLSHIAQELAATGLSFEGKIIFHCSGSLSSEVLAPLRSQAARVASVHPVKSFADPEDAVQTFPGTYCALEGDEPAREVLTEAFTAIGAKIFPVDPSRKAIYHSAAVFASNYLTALLETSLACYQAAGVPRETAMTNMAPLVRGTIDNIFRLGPVQALTGPIARGEVEVIRRQLTALIDLDPEIASIYRQLGQVAHHLATQKPNAPAEMLEEIKRVLRE